MKRILLPAIAATLAILGATQSFGGTIDFATNFNAPNNAAANSAFSYGYGTTSAGFTALNATSLNCNGTPTYCITETALGGFPNNANVSWNGTGSDFVTSGTVHNPPNAVHVDGQGLGVIVRYTAPVTGSYTVAAVFTGVDTGQSTTNTSIFANGVQQGTTNTISAYLATQAYNFTVSLTAGQKLDFIVTNPSPSNDGTALSGTITSPTGTATPEPSSLSLLLLAIPALAAAKRQQR